MENPKNPKTQKEYCCEMCNYNTSHKNDYSKHLTTAKHKNMCLGNKMDIPGNQKTQKNPILFMCSNCNKNYNTNSGLWKYKMSMLTQLNYSYPSWKMWVGVIMKQILTNYFFCICRYNRAGNISFCYIFYICCNKRNIF